MHNSVNGRRIRQSAPKKAGNKSADMLGRSQIQPDANISSGVPAPTRRWKTDRKVQNSTEKEPCTWARGFCERTRAPL